MHTNTRDILETHVKEIQAQLETVRKGLMISVDSTDAHQQLTNLSRIREDVNDLIAMVVYRSREEGLTYNTIGELLDMPGRDVKGHMLERTKPSNPLF